MKRLLPTVFSAALLGLVLASPASAHPGHAPLPTGSLLGAAEADHHDSGIINQLEKAGSDALHAVEGVAHDDEVSHEGEHRALTTPVIWEMIWTLVVFVLFFLILSTVVWPKILGGLKAREDKQRGDLLAAEKARADADKAMAEYQEKLTEARKESQTIVAEARAAAQQAANADKARIESEIASMKASAQAEITAAKEQALADIYAQAAGLSTAIASKILQREINESDQQDLVNQSVEQFKQKASTN